jgi:ribonuclease E
MPDDPTEVTPSDALDAARPARVPPSPAVTEGSAPADPAGEAGSNGARGATGGAGTAGGDAARKRRRRGSRGGRNRRKPAGATRAAAGEAADVGDRTAPDGPSAPRTGAPRPAIAPTTGAAPRTVAAKAGAAASRSDDAVLPGHDYTDEAADRGLTSEDLAADALEDAGLTAPTRPQIGDSRPAPARPRVGDSRPPAAGAPNGGAPGDGAANDGGGGAGERTGTSRRRRRGGRGRGRGGAGGAGGAATGAGDGRRAATGADAPVRADLGTGDALDLDDLDDETLARRRGRTRKGRPAGRYMMCVHVSVDGHTHLAVLEGRNLVEHYVSTPADSDTSIDGNIYLGKVQNVLPGMEAAFVDIGTPKNGVLYRGDVAFDRDEVEESQPKIERLLKNGQPVMVQVTKNPIGAKGARLTQEVSLAGRFVVMVPNQPDTYGISKRLPDDERKRLRRVLEDLRPKDAGLIVRTAAEGATADELERDVRRLRQQWEQISDLAARSKPARLLYQEPPLVLRLLREEFTKEYRGVVIDDRSVHEEVRSYVEAVSPELLDRVEHYDADEEGLPLFERFHIQEQLIKALERKVWLPSGGSLIVERTEALTVIDVNTGKNVGRANLEETVFRNNLEAADEVARQLRLRDIGGIIVIDFIDMEIRENREKVMRALRDALARDKTRTQVFDISELGLVEMTRKRISEGLVESVSETCPTCLGRGFVLDERLLAEMQ